MVRVKKEKEKIIIMKKRQWVVDLTDVVPTICHMKKSLRNPQLYLAAYQLSVEVTPHQILFCSPFN